MYQMHKISPLEEKNKKKEKPTDEEIISMVNNLMISKCNLFKIALAISLIKLIGQIHQSLMRDIDPSH